MRLKELEQTMGQKAKWNGAAHRFITTDDAQYQKMQKQAARLMTLPKHERIRWWARGSIPHSASCPGGSLFVEVAMH